MNVKELRVEMFRHDITNKRLAEELGITNNGLYRKMNRETEFTLPEIQSMIKLLKLSDSRRKDIFFI